MLEDFLDLFVDLLMERNSQRRRRYAFGIGLLSLAVGVVVLLLFAGRTDTAHRPIGYFLVLVGVITIAITYWLSRRARRTKQPAPGEQGV